MGDSRVKKYVYVVVAVDDREILAIYEDKDVANKMKSPIEAKIGTEVEIIKQLVNPDIKVIGQ